MLTEKLALVHSPPHHSLQPKKVSLSLALSKDAKESRQYSLVSRNTRHIKGTNSQRTVTLRR